MTADEKFMKAALREAKKAAAEDEVPVGAVVVKDQKIIARAHNKKEKNGCACHQKGDEKGRQLVA